MFNDKAHQREATVCRDWLDNRRCHGVRRDNERPVRK